MEIGKNVEMMMKSIELGARLDLLLEDVRFNLEQFNNNMIKYIGDGIGIGGERLGMDEGEVKESIRLMRQYLSRSMITMKELKKLDGEYMIFREEVNKYYGREVIKAKDMGDGDARDKMIEEIEEMGKELDDIERRRGEGEEWKG